MDREYFDVDSKGSNVYALTDILPVYDIYNIGILEYTYSNTTRNYADNDIIIKILGKFEVVTDNCYYNDITTIYINKKYVQGTINSGYTINLEKNKMSGIIDSKKAIMICEKYK